MKEWAKELEKDTAQKDREQSAGNKEKDVTKISAKLLIHIFKSSHLKNFKR